MGRIDIAYEVLSLSKFLAQPRTGHIYQALHIFKYLEVHIDNDLTFDPLYQEIQNSIDSQTLICERKRIFVNTTEDLLTYVPTPRGKSFQLNYFLDAEHTSDRVT